MKKRTKEEENAYRKSLRAKKKVGQPNIPPIVKNIPPVENNVPPEMIRNIPPKDIPISGVVRILPTEKDVKELVAEHYAPASLDDVPVELHEHLKPTDDSSHYTVIYMESRSPV